MRLTAQFEPGFREKLQRLSRDFGDDADQATARLAVSMAREIAILTPPRGKDKKAILGAIITDAWRVVMVIPGKFFNHLTKTARPRINMGKGGWQAIRPSQLTRSDRDIYDHIESHRDGKGRVREFKNRQVSMQLITTKPTMNKVLRRRRKLAGVAKGGFLGAGMAAARFQKGADRVSIGKNFMAWAQKHRNLGTARRIKAGEIELRNSARNSGALVGIGEADLAHERAWKNTERWYRRAIKAREKGKLA